jgi:SAM-dependent methyltransferase
LGKVQGVNVVVGIPSFGMVSTYFAQAVAGQGFPLVSSKIDRYVLNKPIAEARNEIVEFALQQGANYIFWLDDDVIAPPDAFLKLYNHNKAIINGVYWSKSNPPMPLLFRGHLEGPYWDWHVGDLIEIDAAGSGLTLVKTEVYRKMSQEMGGPWYSTDYTSFAGVTGPSAPNNTEDLYFYWKAKKLGYKVWADTSVQAYHYDKNSQVLYGMPPNAPQAFPAWAAEVKPLGTKLIADYGSGPVSPYMRDEGTVISFDIREEVKPDVVCDLAHVPVPDQTFDMVFSSHTLEHFSYQGVDRVLREWSRTLKVGGELRLVVPNLRWSAQRILDDTLVPEDLMVLYGEQDYPKNVHYGGFTPKTLKALVESLGIYEDIQTHEGNLEGAPGPDSWNLMLKATKKIHPATENITPEWVEKSPTAENWWPIRTFDVATEKPIDESVAPEPQEVEGADEAAKRKEEITGKKPFIRSSIDFAVFNADTIDRIEKESEEKPAPKKRARTKKAKEVDNGLESNN